MNARSIRRATERKATKQARRAELQQPPTSSEARIQANRANSLLSTGPSSAEGKAKVSLNAVKTGLTGRTVVLPADDTAQYELHSRRFAQDLQPIGDRESELVQNLADTQWRLNRIPSLEIAIYALARIEFAEKFQDYEPEAAASLIEAHAFIAYHRQLNNLSIQEARLRRQFEKDRAELLKLQKERALPEEQRTETIARPHSTPCPSVIDHGFEFSYDDLDALEQHFGLDSEPRDLPKAA